MKATTNKLGSWGVLGNPSKEKIEEYKNMPVGAFRSLVKEVTKQNKGKPLTPHEIWIERKVTDSYVTSMVVSAASTMQAFDMVKLQLDQAEFPSEPTWQRQVTHSYSSMDPRKWSRKNEG